MAISLLVIFQFKQGRYKPVGENLPEKLIPSNDIQALLLFERKKSYLQEAMDAKVKKAGILPLRASAISSGGLEIRVWGGFGVIDPNCFIIRKIGKNWSGAYIPSGKPKKQSDKIKSVRPTSGWSKLWEKLEAENILSLPDQPERKGKLMIYDGITYCVEIKEKGKYYMYSYNNPDPRESTEAAHVLKIFQILTAELINQ